MNFVPRISFQRERDARVVLAALIDYAETQVARVKMGDGDAIDALGETGELCQLIWADIQIQARVSEHEHVEKEAAKAHDDNEIRKLLEEN